MRFFMMDPSLLAITFLFHLFFWQFLVEAILIAIVICEYNFRKGFLIPFATPGSRYELRCVKLFERHK